MEKHMQEDAGLHDIDGYRIQIRDHRGWRFALTVTGEELWYQTEPHADIAIEYYERLGYEARKSSCK